MRSRTKLIAIIASLLVCIAMIGTGFASWVILATQTAESTGNVTAEAVADQKLTLSVTADEPNIFFGSPETMDISNAWLVESEAEGQGKFSVDIAVTVEGNVGSLTIGFAVEGDGATYYEAAKTANLIAEYPTYTLGSDNPTGAIMSRDNIEVVDNEDGTATLKFGDASDRKEGFNFESSTTFHVIATFSWGSAFASDSHGTNPYAYFNEKKKDDTASDWTGKTAVGVPSTGTGADSAVTYADVAKGVLDWMNTNFSNVTYKFTFTAKQAATSVAG